MFYQLTMGFDQTELEKVKKILDLADSMDAIKEVQPLMQETFPWEQEKEITKTEKNIEETVEKVEEKIAPEFTFEELRSACKDYAVHHGKDALKALFEQLGAHKLTEVPEDKQAELWTALNA